MNRSFPHALSVVRVTEDDPALLHEIPLLGIEQGLSHDTKLPDKAEYKQRIAANFRDAMKHVEIWRIDAPVAGCGAVFLSPLTRGGEKGIQVDDIVVMPDQRGKGIGSALLCFTAALAKQRGLSFVAWECEEHNPAQKMYRAVGAVPRANVKPFRLTRDIIVRAIENERAETSSDVGFNVSNRFSLFRTLNHGIDGYDMDPTQKSLGLQIEDLTFDDVAAARRALVAILKKEREARGIDFVDIVVPVDKQHYLDLIASFDAEQNTYSGNPAFLWELSGEAFERAAEKGRAFTVHPM